MPKIENPGRYMVTVQSAEFGESENTGTPFLNLYLVDENKNGIGAWLYLSEKALPNTIKTLTDAFGFNGDFETAVEQITGKLCQITCEMEDDGKGNDRLKVKWINAPRRSAPISDQGSFLKSLTAKAARLPKPAPKAGQAPTKAPSTAKPAAKPVVASQTKDPDPF